MVNVNLDWREALPHPDERVEYEFWTSSNDECGPKCESEINFVKSFKGAAQLLEQKGFTKFTPHYITWYCPEAFILSQQCKSQCINNGRYCAPDPELHFQRGYNGRDVVIQNLRQACFFKVANESGKPWQWWDYVTDFSIRCPMRENKYTEECSDQVIKSLAVKAAVLKAICSGFQETTEPSICLTPDMETNECLQNNGGCWQDKAANITACRDTFRGRVCECPIIQNVQFVGDGYTHCEAATGALRCAINNGGCWKETQGSRMTTQKVASVHLDSGVMVSTPVKMWMSAKRNWCASAQSANAKIPGEVMNARRYMDSEIRAIMAQYMPLDNQPEISSQAHEDV
ncbi:hypothetical protein JHK82_018126 [Glycine max]|nr:hypothetical protein JHK82_018126 [Glycine max]